MFRNRTDCAPCEAKSSLNESSSSMEKWEEEELRKYLLNNTLPSCPCCGHGLDGIKGVRCPECGVSLSVQLFEQHKESLALVKWIRCGLVASAAIFFATCYGALIGFLYLALLGWWCVARDSVEQLPAKTKLRWLWIAWLPVAVIPVAGMAYVVFVVYVST